MNRVLKNLEPERVFYYFEELCNIPRTSFHTERISSYCENFAKEQGLDYIRDEAGNVIIFKPASVGYENVPAVILQGHIDMVGAKTEDSSHDFINNPIEIKEDELSKGYITADRTTLGGDDGAAVAYMLAILEDKTLKHPCIEAVFTVDEEVGLLGAAALDTSMLKGRILLNIDSEDEGIFITGSAGGLRTDLKLPVKLTSYSGTKLTLTIKGLKGGHSGVEIGNRRASANILIGRLLKRIDEEVDYYLVSMYGGEVDNAIAPKCNAVIVADAEDFKKINEICNKVNKELLDEYRGSDDGILITAEVGEAGDFQVVDDISKEKILFLLRNLIYGVVSRSPENVDFIETSLNAGVLRLDENGFMVGYSIRSSIESAKRDITDRIEYLVEFLGGEYEESGDYPSWPYNPNSALRPLVNKVYHYMYGKEPEFLTIHAGLECGIFFNKMPQLDIISYGPDMEAIHTPDEKLYIDSTRRVYEFTVKLLEDMLYLN